MTTPEATPLVRSRLEDDAARADEALALQQTAREIVDGILDTVERAARFEGRGKDRRLVLSQGVDLKTGDTFDVIGPDGGVGREETGGRGAMKAVSPKQRVRIQKHGPDKLGPAEWYVSVLATDGTWTLLDVYAHRREAANRAAIVVDAIAAALAAPPKRRASATKRPRP